MKGWQRILVNKGQAVAHLLLFTMLGMLATPAQAVKTPGEVETQIKAAYLFHFCNYIEWPEDAFSAPEDPLVVAVAGSDMLVDEITRVLSGRFAGTHPIVVRRVDASDSLASVHLLYVGRSFTQANRLLEAMADVPVLVVTEDADGLHAGSAINFIVENDRVRFDIAPETVRRHRLGVSAQLLTVARQIKEPES